MKANITKILGWMGRIVLFVLVAAGAMLLLAERFHETSFVNFIRSLM